MLVALRAAAGVRPRLADGLACARIYLVIAAVSLPRLALNLSVEMERVPEYRTDYWITEGYVEEEQTDFWW